MRKGLLENAKRLNIDLLNFLNKYFNLYYILNNAFQLMSCSLFSYVQKFKANQIIVRIRH